MRPRLDAFGLTILAALLALGAALLADLGALLLHPLAARLAWLFP